MIRITNISINSLINDVGKGPSMENLFFDDIISILILATESISKLWSACI